MRHTRGGQGLRKTMNGYVDSLLNTPVAWVSTPVQYSHLPRARMAGGTEYVYYALGRKFRVHNFAPSGSFTTYSGTHRLEYIAVGGGAGGAGRGGDYSEACGGGGGGGCDGTNITSYTTGMLDYLISTNATSGTVSIGGGGSAGGHNGGSGGTTTLWTSSIGGGSAGYCHGSGSPGPNAGKYFTIEATANSYITNINNNYTYYGSGGGPGGCCASPASGIGGGGGGSNNNHATQCQSCNYGRAGNPGTAVVRYIIA